MTRAAVTKLFLLVIFAFIICLPEFFRIYSVSTLNFHCVPHQPGELKYPGEKGRNDEDERKAICNPPSMPEHEQREQICTEETQRNATDIHAPTQEVWTNSRAGWFKCETDKNIEEFHMNISSTAALVVLLEVSVSFQLNDTETLNLTLYGHSNRSFLHLQPPEEEEDPMGDDADQGEAFYCCLPLIPTSNSANQSHCLLWLANQTVLTGSETERLPWKRADRGGWCRFRVIWLVLLCVVFLTVAAVVVRKIYVGIPLNKKPAVHPIQYQSPNQQLKGTAYPLNRHQFWSGLSPIPEIESQESPSSSLPSSYHLPHRRTGVLTEAQQKEYRNGLIAH